MRLRHRTREDAYTSALITGHDLGDMWWNDPQFSQTSGATKPAAVTDVTVKPGQTVPGFGWPAAVPIRPGNWDVDASTYRLALGDTLSGLASTYLGTPTRWREIWEIQSDDYRSKRSPDHVVTGDVILMPCDALATMLVSMGQAAPEGCKPSPVPPGKGPAQPRKPAGEKKSILPLVLGGAAAAAVVAWAALS